MQFKPSFNLLSAGSLFLISWPTTANIDPLCLKHRRGIQIKQVTIEIVGQRKMSSPRSTDIEL